jgi:hypothetical protein
MGMKPSPYNSVRYFYWGEELARGDPRDSKIPLHYMSAEPNLPWMTTYDPTIPHVYNSNGTVERIAGEFTTFVDDTRILDYSKENAWQVARRITSVLQYLGIQDSPRKRCPPSQSPGACWAGSLQSIESSSIGISVTQEKWDEGHTIVRDLAKECLGEGKLPNLLHKKLEKERGFLVHLGMTFESIAPCLKGAS